MTEKSSVFKTLNDINVNDKVESKNGLRYISWAYAWGILKQHYPDATFKIYENQQGWNYHTDGRTAWVKTGVTVAGVEYIEYLPVMDYRNRSIPLENLTSMDVTKAIQRSLTKAISRHGLGLYIYAGEDLPDEEKKAVDSKPTYKCRNCKGDIPSIKEKSTGRMLSPAEVFSKLGGLCPKCLQEVKKNEA